MVKKVLIFESDATFAEELRGGFARLGCEVSIVEDATQGLQAATQQKPDLILLAVELPRSNGFSVCNKLKRDAGLQAVPVLILSRDSTEETFEQHRRLRGRAEDYIHKPVTFEALLERASKFATFEGAPAADANNTAAIVDDDDLLIDDIEPIADGAPVIESLPPVSLPLESLPAESVPLESVPPGADGAIEDEVLVAPPSIVPISDAPAGSGELEIEPISDAPLEIESIPVSALEGSPSPPAASPSSEAPAAEPMPSAPPFVRPPSRVPARPSSIVPGSVRRPSESADLARLREENERLKQRQREIEESERRAHQRADEFEEAQRRGAARDAEVQRLQRELDEVKAKLASSGKGAGSAREFLDLREQLNKKDK
jgi:CheY-like chemotaxis protein